MYSSYNQKEEVLSKIWTLTAHLEVLPDVLSVHLRECGVAQAILFVISCKQVLDDGARLINRVSWVMKFSPRSAESAYLP